VDSERMPVDESGAEESLRYRPLKTRRRSSEGRFVRSARRDLSVEIVVEGGTEMGITAQRHC
jgi:hypothetical protein